MLFIKIGPQKIQAQNLSNCSQNIIKITIGSPWEGSSKASEGIKIYPDPQKKQTSEPFFELVWFNISSQDLLELCNSVPAHEILRELHVNRPSLV